MFCRVETLSSLAPCEIIGYGHVELGDDPRYKAVTQAEFIRDMMTSVGRRDLLGSEPPWSAEDVAAVAEQWALKTGIVTRNFFSGTTAELGAIAARKCLQKAGLRPAELGAIIGGTNTGPGYPSLADYVKLYLGQESAAMAYDVAEACPVGAVAVFQAWSLIHSRVCDKVLVVCAEKASTLTGADNWRASNLFGDGAFAFLLAANNSAESFVFFDFQSLPFEGGIEKIVKTDRGIYQDGNAVHKFVGRQVVGALTQAVSKAGLRNAADINHVVPHQPSKPTLDFLQSKLQAAWPEFRGVFHRNVETSGNTSGATTGALISAGVHSGLIKSNDLVVVSTFGSGLSIGSYGFRVSRV